MAMLKPNPLIGLIEGTVGDLVFAQTKDGRVRVQHRPVRRTPSTPGELKGQAFITAANQYVARVRREPVQYAIYQNAARIKGKRACDLARSDYLSPPIIHDIDVSRYTGAAGQAIGVQAIDDFEVVAALAATLPDHGTLILLAAQTVVEGSS